MLILRELRQVARMAAGPRFGKLWDGGGDGWARRGDEGGELGEAGGRGGGEAGMGEPELSPTTPG